MTVESDIQRATIVWAEDCGWLAGKFEMVMRSGWPDTIFMKNGVTAFIEFKQPGKDPEPLQVEIIEQLLAQSIFVHVCRSAEKARYFLRECEYLHDVSRRK